MPAEPPLRPSPPPLLQDRPRGAGLYGEVAPLPVSRIIPPPVGEGRTFL